MPGNHHRQAGSRPLADPDPLPSWAYEPYEGAAVGNLVHVDDDSRFHILSVVFPEGTSSGVHYHGCWGLIGYLRGGDEETRYRETGRAANGESVVVRINDRGPYYGDRCLNLSEGAFASIADPDAGVVDVRYEILAQDAT